MRDRRWPLMVCYGLAVVAANWMIRHVGTPIPGGTHLLPVGFGLMAPSGTYAAGAVLVLRDAVQRVGGRRLGLLVIIPAALITALMDVRLAIASATAFTLSELADFAVFTPLQQRRLTLAVVASVLCADVVDSTAFLLLAGIPLSIALPGLLVGKAWLALAAVPLIRVSRRWLVLVTA